MGENVNSAEQLRAVEGAPVLTQAASTGERVLGALSALALCAVLAGAAAVEIPVVLGCVVLLLALALVLRWRWYHLRAPGRRPHTKVEEWMSFLVPVALAIPGLGLLWNNPVALAGALVAAAVPTALFAGYLALRWRR
ncbi:hypothetical protein ACFYOV_14930 [Streptomyces sp. NPDC005931]|uniref:hypothetical protein n=1 Tax=Streptomyces sp. NPDC005931 TaxID=3364737 RepID=UPI00368CE70E